MATAKLSYVAKIDSRKRIILRGAKYECYNVQEMSDGSIILSPCVSFEVSEKTLRTMDEAMENYKSRKLNTPDSAINLDTLNAK